jgi:hypothetical protein
MNTLPFFISILFCLTTLLTVALFYKASQGSKTTLIIIVLWLALQSVLGLSGFYQVTNNVPPRFIFLLAPPVLLIIGLLFHPKGKHFLDTLDNKTLTLLHLVRIPVELLLYGLMLHKAVPELMTFEGRNFDVLSGLSAPVIYYFGFIKKTISPKMILAWNIICLGLLLNIVSLAVLSGPFPFQQFAFDQPNIALLYFPFVWLPCCIVPLVLLSHLAAIRNYLKTAQY